MKKNIVFFFVFSIAIMHANAQSTVSDTSLRKAAIAVCDCLAKSNLGDKASEEQLQQAFLTCMLSSAPDLITQIVSSGEDYEKAGQEIGTKLSMEMMKTGCPAFTKIAASIAQQQGSGLTVETGKPAALQAADGMVTKVEEKDFTYITVKTTAGRELTFIYYSYVPGSDEWIKDAANK